MELLKLQSSREQLLSSMVEIAILQARLEYQHGKRKAALRPSSTDPALAELLNRSELNLLRQIKQGAFNKQIAEALALSEGTVKVYLSRFYEKLHVSSRTQTLAIAQELKLLE